jgi:hypothetical protein
MGGPQPRARSLLSRVLEDAETVSRSTQGAGHGVSSWVCAGASPFPARPGQRGTIGDGNRRSYAGLAARR